MNPFTERENEYTDLTFKDVHVDGGSSMSGKRFDGCTFENCTLAETKLYDCRFQECRFNDCDLSLVTLAGSTFIDTHFHQCKLIGINWTEANWSFLSAIHFYHSDISHSTFIDLSLENGHIVYCKAENCEFSGASLQQCDCQHSNFVQSRFMQTNLSQADFVGASNYAIDITTNTLTDAKFSLPEALALLRYLDIKLIDTG